MKITFKQILESIAPYNELNGMKYTPVVSLKIYKLGKELDRELQTYRDLGRKIYLKYEVPETEAGFDPSNMKDEDRKAMEEEFNELLASEIDIADYKIPIESLDLPNNFVSPNTIGSLEWLFLVQEEKIQPISKPKKAKK